MRAATGPPAVDAIACAEGPKFQLSTWHCATEQWENGVTHVDQVHSIPLHCVDGYCPLGPGCAAPPATAAAAARLLLLLRHCNPRLWHIEQRCDSQSGPPIAAISPAIHSVARENVRLVQLRHTLLQRECRLVCASRQKLRRSQAGTGIQQSEKRGQGGGKVKLLRIRPRGRTSYYRASIEYMH